MADELPVQPCHAPDQVVGRLGRLEAQAVVAIALAAAVHRLRPLLDLRETEGRQRVLSARRDEKSQGEYRA
jgi:hypothetical protein